ncbi:MAG TPA: hypothetical protein VN653_16180 [Anaerolineales bacterium]|nr:hypothetical protein [Anaerolineales bacterium]
MNPKTKSKTKGTGDDIDLDEAKFLWDEYRYRHDLCWRLIFQITTAVVAILIVPYIQPTITKSVALGLWLCLSSRSY